MGPVEEMPRRGPRFKIGDRVRIKHNALEKYRVWVAVDDVENISSQRSWSHPGERMATTGKEESQTPETSESGSISPRNQVSGLGKVMGRNSEENDALNDGMEDKKEEK